MKKPIYLCLFFLTATINGKDSYITNSLKNLIKMNGFYSNIECGLVKYGKKTHQPLVNVENFRAGNTSKNDKITFTKTRPVGLIGFNVGIELSNPSSTKYGRIGTSLSFAKRNNAIEGDYFYSNQPTDLLAIRQDIKRFEWLITGEYDLFNKYNYIFCIDTGFGFSIKALNDIKVYEKGFNDIFFIGQSLIAKKAQFTGRIGFSVQKKVKDFIITAGYKISFRDVKFQNYLMLETPDTRAAANYQTDYTNNVNQARQKLLIFIPPKFTIHAHELKITIGKEF